MNNLALSAALATAPSSAFAELRERPRFWFPLILVILATAGIQYWYYSVVDFEWLKDAMYGNNPDIQALPDEQRAAAMSMISRNTLLWASVVSIAVIAPIVLLLQALYLLVVAKITKLSFGFKHWFTLASWTALPALLAVVVSAILLILADNPQISMGVLAPLSLNELLFHVPMNGRGYTLLTSLNIPTFLGWALMIIGIHTWTQRSWGFCAAVVLLPWVLIFGIAAFFAFR